MSASEPAKLSEKGEFILPKEPALMVLCGKQRSGKSYAIKSLMQDFQSNEDTKFKYGIVFVKTKFNHAYDYIPDKMVKEDFETDKLMKWIDGLRNRQKSLPPGEKLPRNFVILDDLMGVANFYDKPMISWISTFRHTNTWVFLTCQYLAQGTSTVVRECTDLAFIFNTSNLDSQKKLYIFYGQQMPGDTVKEKFNMFQKVLKDVTQSEEEDTKHQCLLFVGNQTSAERSYLAWKADPVEDDFKMKFD
jgi:hypothetical protein